MDQVTHVVWVGYHQPEMIARNYWDQAMLEEMFAKGNYEHHINFDDTKAINESTEVPAEKVGAVVIVNGRTHTEDAAWITEDMAHLRWVLFIITGDEEALFPWRDIHHPLMRVWVQLPRMNEHNDTSYKLVNGYRPQTRQLLKEIGQQERTHDFFFAGQVTHARREQCYEAARGLPNGILYETREFGREVLPYPEYLKVMSSSKIVLCPSGPESPDSFRVYEALEAGCIPIVDAFSTKHQAPGFWQYLLGDDIPFPIVDYWDKLPVVLPQILKEYPENANRVFAWWQMKKREMFHRLTDDVRELSR